MDSLQDNIFFETLSFSLGFSGGSAVKNLPASAGDRDLVPGAEDPLEEGMATYCSILAWSIPWAQEPGGLQFMELQRVRHD